MAVGPGGVHREEHSGPRAGLAASSTRVDGQDGIGFESAWIDGRSSDCLGHGSLRECRPDSTVPNGSYIRRLAAGYTRNGFGVNPKAPGGPRASGIWRERLILSILSAADIPASGMPSAFQPSVLRAGRCRASGARPGHRTRPRTRSREKPRG